MAGQVCEASYTLILLADLICQLTFLEADNPLLGDQVTVGSGDDAVTGATVEDVFVPNIGTADSKTVTLDPGIEVLIVYVFSYRKGTGAEDGVGTGRAKHANYGFSATDLNALLNAGNEANIDIGQPSIVPSEPDVSANASEVRFGVLSYSVVATGSATFGDATGAGAGMNNQTLNGVLTMNTGV